MVERLSRYLIGQPVNGQGSGILARSAFPSFFFSGLFFCLVEHFSQITSVLWLLRSKCPVMATCRGNGGIKMDSPRIFYTITRIECKNCLGFNSLSLAEAPRNVWWPYYNGDASPRRMYYRLRMPSRQENFTQIFQIFQIFFRISPKFSKNPLCQYHFHTENTGIFSKFNFFNRPKNTFWYNPRPCWHAIATDRALPRTGGSASTPQNRGSRRFFHCTANPRNPPMDRRCPVRLGFECLPTGRAFWNRNTGKQKNDTRSLDGIYGIVFRSPIPLLPDDHPKTLTPY